jgi:hypothetical protein
VAAACGASASGHHLSPSLLQSSATLTARHERARVLHTVPHVRQAFNWDCGLACVCMVLRHFGRRDADLYSLRQLCPTTSIWTVDLAFLLKTHGVPVSFWTVTLGANPDFENESFYRENMAEDCERVNRLFLRAKAEGIRIEHASVSADALLERMVSGRYVFIVLVDKRRLTWYRSKGANAGRQAGGGVGAAAGGASASNSGYTGHYVVVCGYEDGLYVVRDPASTAPESVRVPPEALESARKCFGTDEDILLIESPAQTRKENAR